MGYAALPRGGVLEALSPMDLRDPAPERNPPTGPEHPGPVELACLDCRVEPDCNPADPGCRNGLARAHHRAHQRRDKRRQRRSSHVPEVFRGAGGRARP